MEEAKAEKLFLFLNSVRDCRWFLGSAFARRKDVVIVVPSNLSVAGADLKQPGLCTIRNWSGNQTRFSRIKYAILQGVLQNIITTDSTVVCALGPAGKNHLDTVTIHDLALSWSEEFPFDLHSIVNNRAFYAVMAVVDIALDIGALGREGKSIGTTFIVGDEEAVLKNSHQGVFNPFKGYPRRERLIGLPEVVESIKELAKLDGALIISTDGAVEAAGRILDAGGVVTKRLRGLGSRHRTAAGITRVTGAVAVVVSESTGKVTIFEKGCVVATLEPLISRRLV